MRSKKPKRREERIVSVAKNEVWSMDFVLDALFTGEKLWILTIVDDYTQESPGIGIRLSYKESTWLNP